jgi:hypothetical protein
MKVMKPGSFLIFPTRHLPPSPESTYKPNILTSQYSTEIDQTSLKMVEAVAVVTLPCFYRWQLEMTII